MSADRIDALLALKPVVWRLSRSIWILVVVLGCGVGSFLGWLCAGLMARSQRVWYVVTFWSLSSAVLWFMILYDETAPYGAVVKDVTTSLLALSWLAGPIHARLVRRTVLRAVVSREDAIARLIASGAAVPGWVAPSPDGRAGVGAAWTGPGHAARPGPGGYGPPSASAPGGGMSGYPQYHGSWEASAASAPVAASPLASSPEEVADPEGTPAPDSDRGARRPSRRKVDVPTGLVDANTAGASELETISSLDAEAITRILAARQRLGGFHDLDELVSAADLQPHHVFRMREQVIFSELAGDDEARRGQDG